MEVEDPDRRQRIGRAVEQLVELRERRVELIHEDPAHRVDDRDLVAGIGVVDEPAAAGCLVRIVDRPQDGAIGVEVLVDLALIPDVVAAGDDVNAAVEQLLGQARGETGTGRHVLTVRDDEIDVPVVPQLRQDGGHRQPARLADDVADDADANLVAAGAHRA